MTTEEIICSALCIAEEVKEELCKVEANIEHAKNLNNGVIALLEMAKAGEHHGEDD